MHNINGHILSTRSKLPTEILENIFTCLARTQLRQVQLVNRRFQDISSRLLYRTVVGLSPARAIPFLRTLTRKDAYTPFVREFEFDSTAYEHLTGNVLPLLNRVLRRLKALKALTLEFPPHEWQDIDITRLCSGCTFKLRSFTTSLQCDAHLAHFLSSQPGITELAFGGLRIEEGSSFQLKSDALPALTVFRTVQSSPKALRAVISGRPVRTVSVSILGQDTEEALDALTKGSVPLTRISLMSFEAPPPMTLLSTLAKYFPCVEALHIIAMLSSYNTELLVECAPALSQFKALKYLTYMAPGNEFDDDKEPDIAAIWHKHCPSLCTIILPRGLVWFQRDSEWSCEPGD